MASVSVSYNSRQLEGAMSAVKRGSGLLLISPKPYTKTGNAATAFVVKQGRLSQSQIKSLCATAITQNGLFPIGTNQYYHVSADKTNANGSMRTGILSMSMIQFNNIILNNIYTALWTTAQDTKHIYYTNDLGLTKRQVGATSRLGNGFYFKAGYYDGGKAILNGDYAIFSVNPSNAGEKKAIGNVNQIRNYLSSAMSADATAARAKNFMMVKLIKDDTTQYNYKLCAGGLSHGVSLAQIQSWLNDNDSSSGNSEEPDGGSNYGGISLDGNYSSAYDTVSVFGGLVNPESSITALEYINDFSNYKLVFKPGKDARTTKKPLYEKPEEGVVIDEKKLIIKAQIPKGQVPTSMTLSNKYYNYVKIDQANYSPEEFFTYLDQVLNLDFTGEHIWKKDSPPLIKLNHEADKDSLVESKWEKYPVEWRLIPMTSFAVDKKWYNTLKEEDVVLENILKNKESKAIGLKDFFLKDSEERIKNKLLFFDVYYEGEKIKTKISDVRDFTIFLNKIAEILEFGERKTLECVLKFEQKRKSVNLYELKLFEAFTRGHDFIQEDYTTVRPQEQDVNGNRSMDFDDNYFVYKYTGRDFDILNGRQSNKLFELPDSKGVYCSLVHEKDLLTETDITLGETYGVQKYFVEAMKFLNSKTNKYEYKDTFKVKDYLEATDPTIYTEDDIEIITTKIDLTQCQYYDATKATYQNGWCDCSFGGDFDKECIYQKLGYCPYRFQTEKHPRRIRTLSQEKSNRFNLIQELSKVFEIYPQFYIEFDKNGKILLDENGKMKKHVFFMTEKGGIQQIGFRYEKNLANISRTVDSSSLTTKLYVENVDSELSKTGMCSIETAEDNVGKNSYIMDFSYYTQKGLLNAEQVVRDLYGIDKGDFAFLPTISYYNEKYDDLTNLIINMTGEAMKELKAANIVSDEGITTALEERQKISQRMYQFKVKQLSKDTADDEHNDYTTSDSYKNYLLKLKEQATILWGLVEDLFFSNNYFNLIHREKNEKGDYTYEFQSVEYGNKYEKDLTVFGVQKELLTKYADSYCRGELFWRLMIEGFENENYIPPFESWEDFRQEIIQKNLYITNGKAGQYKSMYEQVKIWKLKRSEWLNKINDISDKFYKKYEPYIKEGTWTDSDYLTDNEYYWAAVSVLADSCKPQLTYNISVIDLSSLGEDYTFELADTTFIEDIDFFGINEKTGLPNRQKVLISAIDYNLDNPQQNSIEVQNYTSAFEDLFESITASVQSLSFNENTYKRAANFTATKYISKESLQGTLFEGDLTLINTNDDNITVNEEGTTGKGIDNKSSQYKLTGEGLYFSKDGGQTWDTGVGPNGINADYIKFGQLDASKIQIVDGNYIYFLWDKDGISAYRSPATSTSGLVDFTRFNKYGLSLIENNNVRLRAGYEFRSGDAVNLTGDYRQENELTNQNVGFYLYNDSGQAIFKTETASDYADVKGDYSARLSLTGEMFITNKVLESDNNGQTISAKPEYQYSGGYYIYESTIVSLSENSALTEIVKQYTDGKNYSILSDNYDSEGNLIPDTDHEAGLDKPKDNVSLLVDEEPEEKKYYITVYKVNNISDGDSIYYYFNNDRTRITRVDEGQVIEIVLSYSIYRIEFLESELENGKIKPELLDKKFSDSTPIGIYNTSLYRVKDGENNLIKAGYPVKALLLQGNEPNAHIETADDIQVETITCWNIKDLEVGQATDIKTDYSLYKINGNYEGVSYQYWAAKELTGKQIELTTSEVKTDEVGIFINNKTAIHGGSEIVRNEESSEIVEEGNKKEDKEQAEEKSKIETAQTYGASSSSVVDIDSTDFVIIGDSITVGLSTTPLKDRAIGIGSASVDSHNRVPHTAYYDNDAIKKAKNLAFFFGVNDVNMGYSKEDYFKLYQETIDTILAKNNLKLSNVNIYIMSMIYITSDASGYSVEKNNKFQTEYLEAFAKSKNYKYIDVYSKTQNIPRTDGIHCTGQGYVQLYNIIKDAFANTTTNTTNYNENKPTDASIISSRETILAGAERIFMSALSGESNGDIVYKNILSILKNGCLYIGGTVSDYYGRKLNMSSFGLMPDEVRINNAKIVMANDGKVWMDFHNLYAIDQNGNLTDTSLWDLLEQLSNGISSISGGGASTDTSGLTEGYYLIDPIKD